MGTVRITYDGRLALTTAQAAARHGILPGTMRKEIDRLGIQPLPEGIDARTPLYLARDLDKVMKARPGKGANRRRRPREATVIHPTDTQEVTMPRCSA
jgi:hypothetical protein